MCVCVWWSWMCLCYTVQPVCVLWLNVETAAVQLIQSTRQSQHFKWNTQFTFHSKSVMLGLLTITLVSSTNKMVLRLIFIFSKFVILGMSLIYSKKSRGPSINPCGTTYLMVLQLEIYFFEIIFHRVTLFDLCFLDKT